MSARGILIYVEGDTEVAFYKAVVQNLKPGDTTSVMYPKIIFRNARGIGNFQNKAARVFKNQVLIDYPGIAFDVALCYDTDVFEYSSKPPINWGLVEADLISAGANRVYHIKAKKTIEDWFLLDYPGVLKYLRLPLDTRLPSGDGIHKIQSLFKKSNKVYVKGANLDGFIDQLDIVKIIDGISKELKPLIRGLSL